MVRTGVDPVSSTGIKQRILAQSGIVTAEDIQTIFFNNIGRICNIKEWFSLCNVGDIVTGSPPQRFASCKRKSVA